MLATVSPTQHIAAMEEIFMLRRRQRGGFMAHRPDCHELEDVVKTELQARPVVPQADPPGGRFAGNVQRGR